MTDQGDKSVLDDNANSQKEGAVEKLLRERMRLEEKLQDHSREITVMFTDIKGSTSFFESYGDIEGRQMVQKHNDMLFPLIQAHHGKIIKTIGDAIMATFEEPELAVKAAITMQMALEKNNRGEVSKNKIGVRIGLNTGLGLVEEKDVYGDVVNLAARVEAQADAGQILLSSFTYQKVRSQSSILCRYFKSSKVRGKEEEIKLYRVVWADEDRVHVRMRSEATQSDIYKSFMLDIELNGNIIKASLSEHGGAQKETLQQYISKTVDEGELSRLARQMTEQFQQAKSQGKINNDALNLMRESGKALVDLLLVPEIQEKLKKVELANLLIRMNEPMVQVPWEMLHLADEFFCLKYNIGRSVTTSQKVSERPQRNLELPLRMMAVIDPTEDLPFARAEGKELVDLGEQLPNLLTVFANEGVTRESLSDEMCNFDLCHFAGHGEYDEQNPEKSSWRLKGGVFPASDIANMSATRPLPSLVFSNACFSGKTESWQVSDHYNEQLFGMANAFLLAGARHYLGSFWEVTDQSGHTFAARFYNALLAGEPVGQAVRLARQALFEKYGEDSILWASYLLYGDPSMVYFPVESLSAGESDEGSVTDEKAMASTPSQEINSSGQDYLKWLMGAAIVLAVAIGGVALNRDPAPAVAPSVIVIENGQGGNNSDGIKDALVMYQQGKFAEALPLLQARVNASPDDRMAAAFLKSAQSRVALINQKEKQKEIEQLTKDLIARHKAGGEADTVQDRWTSRPLSVAFLDMALKGDTILDAGKQAYVPLGLVEGLQLDSSLKVVDRALLEQLLTELKLGSSELADSEAQLQVGRILAARLLMTGTILGMGDQGQISVRIVDTETSEIVGQVRERFGKEGDIFAIVDQLAAKAVTRVSQAYPLQCRVKAVADNGQLELNAGRNIGLKKGMQLVDSTGAHTITVQRVEKSRAFASGASLTPDARLMEATL